MPTLRSAALLYSTAALPLPLIPQRGGRFQSLPRSSPLSFSLCSDSLTSPSSRQIDAKVERAKREREARLQKAENARLSADVRERYESSAGGERWRSRAQAREREVKVIRQKQ